MGIKKKRRAKDPNMGMSKHRKSGHAHGANHFTGLKAGRRIRRKKKLSGNASLTRRQRKMRRGSHVNKYSG